jgi:DNA-binding NarL/FixJ family response regulator
MDDLVEAVRRVHAGELIVAGEATSIVLSDLRGEASSEPALAALTPRELEVLAHVAAGHTNPEIAGALHITQDTVKTHVSHIRQRLGLGRRVQLARYAADLGLA